MVRSLSLAWHIALKDLRHLRWPLTLWILVMVAKLVFFASVSGLIGTPNENWLTRLHSGPELLVSLVLEPFLAYFLLGYLIFEDSLVEGDAFWITRPISGARLLGAKLLGAGLIFFLVPVLVNLPWWLACGFGGSQIGQAALLVIAQYVPVVLIGFTCATLTNGFPRYVLWTLAGCSGVIILLVAVAFFLGPRAKQVQVSVLIPCELALLAALVVHQFVTRRLHRSLGLLAAGTIAAAFVGLFWPWDTNGAVMRALTRDKIGNEKIKATVDGASLYTVRHQSALMTVPVRLEGVPTAALMFVQAQANWSLNHQVVWKRAGYGTSGFGPAAPGSAPLQRAKADASKADTAVARSGGLYFSVSPLLAERMTREPAAFHADIDVRLYDSYVAADLPLREQSQRTKDGSVLIRDIQPVRMTPELHRELNLSNRTPVGADVVLIHLIQRFGDLPGHVRIFARAWIHPQNDIVLTKLGTNVVFPGEVSLSGFNFFNAVGVLSETVVFKLPSSSVDLTDFQLRIYGYENDRYVICPVDADPLMVRAVAEGAAPKS